MFCSTRREEPDVAGYDFHPRQGFRKYESQYSALGIGGYRYDEGIEPEVAGFSKKFKKLRKKATRAFKKYVRPLAPVAGTLLGGPLGGMVGGIIAGGKKSGPLDGATPGIMPEPMMQHFGGSASAPEYGPPPPPENGSLGPRGSFDTSEGSSKIVPFAILAAAVGVVLLARRR